MEPNSAYAGSHTPFDTLSEAVDAALTGYAQKYTEGLLPWIRAGTGAGPAAYHDEHVRGLRSKRIQVDEIWSFTFAKQKNAATAKGVVDHVAILGRGPRSMRTASFSCRGSWVAGTASTRAHSWRTWHTGSRTASSSPATGTGHGKLRTSPAMAAGVTGRLWEVADIVALVEAADVKPGKRGPYSNRKANSGAT